VKAFVNNFNHFTWTKSLVENLYRLGAEPVIVDNASTYPPLIEWYDSTSCEIIRLETNTGHLAPWSSGSVNRIATGYYIVTDSDLDISEVPNDTVSHLIDGYNKHKVVKCGLSIRIDDLPETKMGQVARTWEAHFWARPTGDGFFHADIDTTFAVYHKDKEPTRVYPALRANSPYTARHMPWYITPHNITEEFEYFMATTSKSETSSWNELVATIYEGSNE